METSLQIVLGLIGLTTTIFVWWIKRSADIKKDKDDLDKKIDDANSITDFIDIDDKLRK